MHRISSVLLLGIALTGCNSGDALLKVTGTVKFSDGDPVSGELATIVFQPVVGSGNKAAKSASGTIDPDGSFSLMTTEPGDGAYAGDYKVVLKVWENYRGQKLAVPERYGEAATTPLEATVSRDQREFDLIVER